MARQDLQCTLAFQEKKFNHICGMVAVHRPPFPPPLCTGTSNVSLFNHRAVVKQCLEGKKRRLTSHWSLDKTMV